MTTLVLDISACYKGFFGFTFVQHNDTKTSFQSIKNNPREHFNQGKICIFKIVHLLNIYR